MLMGIPFSDIPGDDKATLSGRPTLARYCPLLYVLSST